MKVGPGCQRDPVYRSGGRDQPWGWGWGCAWGEPVGSEFSGTSSKDGESGLLLGKAIFQAKPSMSSRANQRQLINRWLAVLCPLPDGTGDDRPLQTGPGI